MRRRAVTAEQFRQKPSLLYVVLISSVAALGGFLFGFDSAVINGTVTALERTFATGSVATGFAVSSVLLGSAVGAYFAGQIANRYGRKAVMGITSLAFLVSAVGSGSAPSELYFVVFRLLGGLGIGAASVIAPAYIAEVSPALYRGRLGSLQQMAIVVGIFAAFMSNYLIAHGAGSAQSPFWFGVAAWRWMFWVGVIPSLAYGVGALLIPESPRYLVARMRECQAEAVLRRVEGGDVSARIHEIAQTLHLDRPPRLGDLFAPNGWPLRIVWVGMLLSMFQQLVGINVIFYYGAVLWQAAGFSEKDSLTVNVITSTVNIASTVVSILLIDRLGRRPLLIAGGVGMALTLGLLALLFAQAPVDARGELVLDKVSGLVALVAANLYVFCFGVSWGPVVWVMLGEIFNNQIRASALALAAAVQWIANFAITMSFPILLGSLGLGAAYGLYCAAALLSVLFVSTMVRETKGVTLERM